MKMGSTQAESTAGRQAVITVDDDPVARGLHERMLSNLAYPHQVFENGEGAWEAFVRSDCRIVVSDWSMPGLDGLELCRRIRRMTERPYTYFILMTAFEETAENLTEAIDAGVDDFLHKPVAEHVLWSRLRVAERLFSYSHQLKLLGRLIPICMYCKKVRDDEDYWQVLEEYLNREWEAEFSHGICPECYEKLHADTVPIPKK